MRSLARRALAALRATGGPLTPAGTGLYARGVFLLPVVALSLPLAHPVHVAASFLLRKLQHIWAHPSLERQLTGCSDAEVVRVWHLGILGRPVEHGGRFTAGQLCRSGPTNVTSVTTVMVPR
jgi:hypothetical protein